MIPRIQKSAGGWISSVCLAVLLLTGAVVAAGRGLDVTAAVPVFGSSAPGDVGARVDDVGYMTIYGNTFADKKKQVFLNSYPLSIVSWQNQRIVVRLPYGVLGDFTYQLTVSKGSEET